MNPKKIYKTIAISTMIFVITLTYGVAPAFGMVMPGKTSKWASQNVSRASSYGILPPYFEGKDMTKPATRKEFAQITVLLYEKIKGVPVKPSTKNPFKDTNDPGVLKAYSLGIIKGQGDNIFNPSGLVNREQAATMLTRAYTKSTGNRLTATGVGEFYDDAGISLYARPSIYYMVYKEFIKGTGQNKFTPKGTATCEQVITMAIRMVDEVLGNRNKPPAVEYIPGIKVNTLKEAQDMILAARVNLSPEVTLESSKGIYEQLLSSPFTENTGIKTLRYYYDSGKKKLQVTITYSIYTEILALTDNPGTAYLYASSIAKDLNSKFNNILKEEILPGMGDYEKEKTIHDYMIKNYKFDTSVTVYDLEHPSQSVEGLLYYNKGICQAYAEVFDLFMKKMRVPSQMVWGKVSGEDHVWNMVKLSGQWSMVDVTWDDPVPDRGDRISYEYFNLTDEQLGLTHTWDKSKYPRALGNKIAN